MYGEKSESNVYQLTEKLSSEVFLKHFKNFFHTFAAIFAVFAAPIQARWHQKR